VAARGRQSWGRASWRRELLFDSATLEIAVPHSILHFALVHGEEGMTFGLFVLSL